MKTLSDIEAAIQQLPTAEMHHLAHWLQDYLNQAWDRQMESDLASGKLDHLIAQAEAHIKTSQISELDAILRNLCQKFNDSPNPTPS